MDEEPNNEYFWPAYVDFMSVLFFIALGIGGFKYIEYERKIADTKKNERNIEDLKKYKQNIEVLKKYERLVKEAISIFEQLKNEFKKQNIFIDTDIIDKIKLKGDFYFDTDKDILKNQAAIDTLIRIGKSVKNVLDLDSNKYKYSILIEGHTDDRGGEEYNNNLSFRRALSISQLWKKDCDIILPDYEIIPAGFGELKPSRPNINESNRSDNRRIEVSIIPKMSEFTKMLQKD